VNKRVFETITATFLALSLTGCFGSGSGSSETLVSSEIDVPDPSPTTNFNSSCGDTSPDTQFETFNATFDPMI
jgi:hypothetical protein